MGERSNADAAARPGGPRATAEVIAVVAATLSILVAPAWAGPTLDKVRRLDALVCGVSTGTEGYSAADMAKVRGGNLQRLLNW